MAPLRRFTVAVFVCVLGLMLLVSIAPAQTERIDSVPTRPQGGFIVASETSEFTAEAFTDSLGHWTNDANAYDGDPGTFAYQSTAVVADEYPSAYGHTFDSLEAGSGTISQVDIIVRMQVTGLTGSSDYWALTLDVSTSTGNALSGTQYNLALTNLTYYDVTEPNGGGWSWVEVRAIQLHIDTEKDKGSDGGQINVYEFVVKVTYEPPSGDNYYFTASETIDLVETLYTSVSLVAHLGEILTLSETIATSVSLLFSVLEIVSIAGVVATERIASILFLDGFDLSSTVYTAISLSASLGEVIDISSVVSTILHASNSFNEIITILSSVAVEIGASGQYSIIINELIEIVSSLITTVDWSASLGETIEVLSSVTATINPVIIIVISINELLPIIGNTIIEGGLESLDIFYDLFLSGNMYSILGPIGIVVIGYILANKDKALGVLWFIVESLFVVWYAGMLEANPSFIWHMVILLLGGILILIPALMKR